MTLFWIGLGIGILTGAGLVVMFSLLCVAHDADVAMGIYENVPDDEADRAGA